MAKKRSMSKKERKAAREEEEAIMRRAKRMFGGFARMAETCAKAGAPGDEEETPKPLLSRLPQMSIKLDWREHLHILA